jgi:transposase
MPTMSDTTVKRVGKAIGGATIIITPDTFTVSVPVLGGGEVKKVKAKAPKKARDTSLTKRKAARKVRRVTVRRHSRSHEKELGALLAFLALTFPNDVTSLTKIIRELVYWLIGRI